MRVREISLGAMDKVTVWHSNLETIGHLLPEDPTFDPPRLALEWYGPRGPYCIYGLLGAKLLPGGDSLSVRVETKENERIRMPDDVPVARIDKVHLGLIPAYANAVRRGSTAIAGPRPSGALVFDQAIYGEVGSSEFVFERLAACVTELLGSHTVVTDMPESDLKASLERLLRQPKHPSD